MPKIASIIFVATHKRKFILPTDKYKKGKYKKDQAI